MPAMKVEQLPIRSDADVVQVRHVVRALCAQQGFSLVDQTKMVTAASELARNALQHGGGGFMLTELVEQGLRRGLKLVFQDEGPGIGDLTLAMKDGYSTGGGLGLGLPGSKRLVSEFDLVSEPGKGTRVTVVRWK